MKCESVWTRMKHLFWYGSILLSMHHSLYNISLCTVEGVHFTQIHEHRGLIVYVASWLLRIQEWYTFCCRVVVYHAWTAWRNGSASDFESFGVEGIRRLHVRIMLRSLVYFFFNHNYFFPPISFQFRALFSTTFIMSQFYFHGFFFTIQMFPKFKFKFDIKSKRYCNPFDLSKFVFAFVSFSIFVYTHSSWL